MDTKKENLVAEYNKNQEIINQLAVKNQRILGALELLAEQDKLPKKEDNKKQ